MAIDDAAGRKAVRERQGSAAHGESVFVTIPRHSTRNPTQLRGLREDVHTRGIDAAKGALRAYNAARTAQS